MPDLTPNYNLKKPKPNEHYDIHVQNENMDTIDTELKELHDEKASKDELNNAIGAIPDPTWENLQNKPEVFPPSSHNHSAAEVALGNVDNVKQASKTEHDQLASDFSAHQAEKATQTELGHVMVDGETISITSDGTISSDVGFSQDIDPVRIGLNTTVASSYAVALGRDASAAGNLSTAVGGNAIAENGSSPVALGRNASAAGNYATALGSNATVDNSYEGALGSMGSATTSNWIVPGTFTVNGTKNFEIPHPKQEKKDTHVIRHGAVESPTAGDTLYRYKVQATQNNDIQLIDLPDYFVHLNKDVQIFVTPQGHFGNGFGVLDEENEQLKIHCQYEGKYNVLVIGTRNDDHASVQEWDIKGEEREIGESWIGETYVFSVDEIMEVEEIKEESA